MGAYYSLSKTSMIKEEFEVIEIKNQTMKLKVNRASGCHSCSLNSGCGTGLLSKYFEHYYVLNKPLKQGVKVGEMVTLEISSKALFYRAFQLYLLPLFGLFLGGLLGSVLYSTNEAGQIILAFAGFSACLLFIKYFIK